MVDSKNTSEHGIQSLPLTQANGMLVRVARKHVEAQDICSFELVHPEGKPLPTFSAGSHLDVHVGEGLVRQYSLCNPPSETHRYLLGILRDPKSRGGSLAMHQTVHEGDFLQISTPKNYFKLATGSCESLLLAGGIGITPLLSMAEHLYRTDSDFEMHYCSRSRSHTAFVQRIKTSPFAAQVHLHFDDKAPNKFDGLLDLDAVLTKASPETHLYVCGPQGFMNAMLGTARARGWPEAQLHFEYFNATVAKGDTDTSFEVVLASSGRVIHVATDQTVVQALQAVGINLPTSCEQGVCGTCLTRVIEGEPDHKDMYLTPQERAKGDQFMPCCSRAKSQRLVLDI